MQKAFDDNSSKGAEEEACPGYQIAPPLIRTKKYIIGIQSQHCVNFALSTV